MSEIQIHLSTKLNFCCHGNYIDIKTYIMIIIINIQLINNICEKIVNNIVNIIYNCQCSSLCF